MKKFLLRALLCLLTLVMVFGAVSCSNQGKTLMTLEKDGIEVTLSVNIYQLYLGRIKATLSEIQNVSSDDFWNTWIGSPAKTMDQYYRDNILENCKNYLISLYLFEKYNLELSDAELAEVETIMNEFLITDGGGSKTKLNSVLSEYGVNYDILEDVYLMEAKIEKLQTYLYGEDASLIGDDIKTAYMLENYVHYRQLYLPFSKYVYETDANGDDIYFYPSEDNETTVSDKIYYDTGNGNKSDKTDANGDTIYYKDDGKTIAYNTNDGLRKKLLDEDGNYQITDLTDDERKALKTQKDTLLAQLQNSTNKKFEATVDETYAEMDLPTEQNTDGYYIRRATYSGSSSYLNNVIATLDGMENGDVDVVESDYGYFIIKKYEFTEKAYDLDANKNGWFEDFNNLVINQSFTELCEPYLSGIVVDEALYAEVPSMKSIKTNYFY